MLEIQTAYHIDECVYVRFTQDGRAGEAWLQLPDIQTSRHNVELDGVELDQEGILFELTLEDLLMGLHELYSDKVIRHLFYAGCDVDNIADIVKSWENGCQNYTVELTDGSFERYKEVTDVGGDFFFVKED